MTTLPPERFYWALLDTSRLPRRFFARGPSRRQLGYLLEPLLPVPLEGVHATYGGVKGGRFVACAADEETLRTALGAGALSLAPAALPPFLAETDLPPSRLNLLTGPFEPALRRVRRRNRTLAACGVIALIAVLLVTGLERRAAAARAEERLAQVAAEAVLARVFSTRSTQPGELRLVAELRRLRADRVPTGDAPPDASESLAAILAHWPVHFDGRVELLIIAPTAITATAAFADHESAQRLAAALATVPGWSPEQPQVRADRDGVRAVIRLARRREATP